MEVSETGVRRYPRLEVPSGDACKSTSIVFTVIGVTFRLDCFVEIGLVKEYIF